MTEPRSKAALLELIESKRGRWDDMVAEIGEDRMLQPGATGDWNFKDVVAHLNGWRDSEARAPRQELAGRIEAAAAENGPPRPAVE